MAIIVKTEEQIEGIRRSCQLAADALNFAEKLLKDKGTEISTGEIDHILDRYIRDAGGIPAPLNYLGFTKSICVSINEVICHGIPSDDCFLKDGDIVNVDITTILNGYYGDTSRMFAVGETSEEARKLLGITQDCLAIGIGCVRPDTCFGEIGKKITEYATARGYSVVNQFCGHGTGVRFHEEPQINHYHEPSDYDHRKMEPGMIFTIEPMINIGLPKAVIDKDRWTARTCDGKLSAQYEHTILVTEFGAEVLTK